MKKYIFCLLMTVAGLSQTAYSRTTAPNGRSETPNSAEKTNRKSALVVYFSWGGTTQRVAERIVGLTGADLFRIETVKPYPSDYTQCTEVAKVEVDNGVRPELKGSVANIEQYDVIFVGCPVWWHTAPMAVWSFLEDEAYDFNGKTIVPFCTYAATYRDETLAKIVALTPGARHLDGFGSTGPTDGVADWLRKIGITE